jgi:hypothetical protein
LWYFQLLFGAADFVDKFLHSRMIFSAGLRFDAAGNVNRIRANGTDRGTDVFRPKATR